MFLKSRTRYKNPEYKRVLRRLRMFSTSLHFFTGFTMKDRELGLFYRTNIPRTDARIYELIRGHTGMQRTQSYSPLFL